MYCCTHRFQSLLVDTAPVVKDFETLGLVRRVDAGREIGKPFRSYAPSRDSQSTYLKHCITRMKP
jgi:hypothetical protein